VKEVVVVVPVTVAAALHNWKFKESLVLEKFFVVFQWCVFLWFKWEVCEYALCFVMERANYGSRDLIHPD